MLRIEGLSAAYGPRPVLSDIDLHVDAGETVALLGANTAGKTTMIRAITGTAPRVSGKVLFENEDITAAEPPASGAGIACVPEGRHVFRDMTVTENLVMGAFHRRTDFEKANSRRASNCFHVLESVSINSPELSGGEQQMVAICRALWRSRNFCCWTSRSRSCPADGGRSAQGHRQDQQEWRERSAG
jgi:branched-chain amino acid transport system ATP-binding protein